MPDYYKICACPPASDEQQSISQRLQLIEQSSRTLELKFSINDLKDTSRVQSNLFAWQSEQLQRIEAAIVESERNLLFSMIAMREKATVQRITAFEKEQAARRQLKA